MNPFEKSPGLWVIVAVVVGINLWFDYYHPPGFILDGIILIVLLIKWASHEWPSDRNGQ